MRRIRTRGRRGQLQLFGRYLTDRSARFCPMKSRTSTDGLLNKIIKRRKIIKVFNM